MEGFGGEDTIFYMMVDKLESMTLNKIMKDLVPAYDNLDYKEIKMLAHSLKGASAYIGASRLHYACFFIQAHFVNGEFQKQIEYYPTLVEAAMEFKVYSRKIMAKHQGVEYVWSPDQDQTDHSS